MNLREWALPVYTVLMQLSTGALFFLWIIRTVYTFKYDQNEIDRFVRNPILVIFITGLVAILGSHFHLSKPYLSFLAAYNFRTSWLSREIVFTTLFMSIVAVLVYMEWFKPGHSKIKTALGWTAIAVGAVNIYCMASIYLLPTQEAWDTPTTILSYAISTLLLGGMSLILLMVLDYKFLEVRYIKDLDNHWQIIKTSFTSLSVIVIVTILLLITKDFYNLYFLESGEHTAQLSLQLLLGLYKPLFVARLAILTFVAAGLIVLLALVIRKKKTEKDLLLPVYSLCLFVLIGEILGRFLFYASHIRLGL
jgi:anaerobic dimethyl sulfoxide reductase subunit C